MQPSPDTETQLASLLDSKRTDRGASLAVLSLISPVLVVFLRHPGCTFCREAVSDLALGRKEIEDGGVRIVVLSHGDEEAATALLARHGLAAIERLHDFDQALYRAFGLNRGTPGQLAGPKVLLRGIQAGWLDGHGLGPVAGDPRQLPGVFLIHHCKLVRSFRHRTAADRPDYRKLAGIEVQQE